MNPFFLGTSQRRLFGIHMPAVSRTGKPRAAVLCQPWGNEYIYAHRSMRQLAVRLPLCGFHTLRFDYFGTGDSAGEECETDAAGLQGDVVTAIDTLRDLAMTEKVTLIGLRAGANIAASAAIGFPGTTEALILWDPILPGDPSLEGVLRELPPIVLESCADTLPGRSLMLVTQNSSPPEVSSRLQGRDGARPSLEFLPAPCPWLESASTSGIIPVRVIQRIEEWLR